MTQKLTVLSLGWGVQSFTIAAMAALGELKGLDLAVHADTGHENPATYEHARKYTPWLEERGIPVVTVHPSNNDLIRMDWGSGSVQIPAFSSARTGEDTGQVRRQCTRLWKIIPIREHIRTILPRNQRKPGAVESWQGISYDECHRMRTSDVKYIVNRYPLAERRITRMDCVQWLLDHGLDVPPKSACVFCPFQRRDQWKRSKREGGPTWLKIIEADRQIREVEKKNQLFLHSARTPMEEAVKIPEDEGASQLEMDIGCDAGTCFV